MFWKFVKERHPEWWAGHPLLPNATEQQLSMIVPLELYGDDARSHSFSLTI